MVVAVPALPLALRRARPLERPRDVASTARACAAKCETDPALGYDLMKRFAQVFTERLQWTRLRLLDIYGDASPESHTRRGRWCRGRSVVASEARRRPTRGRWRWSPVSGQRPEVEPGQFVMVYVFGVGEVPISVSARPLVLAPSARSERSRRRSARASPATCSASAARSAASWPIAECEGADVVVVAGGIGLAPLRPVVHRALGPRRVRRGGPSSTARGRRSDLLYASRARELAYATADVDTTVDAAGPEWTGKVGFVPQLLPAARFDPGRRSPSSAGPRS